MRRMQYKAVRNYRTREQILKYMISFATEQGRQPSVREIGEAAGLHSVSTTAGYLRRMVNEGLLAQNQQTRRNYFVTEYAEMKLLGKAG